MPALGVPEKTARELADNREPHTTEDVHVGNGAIFQLEEVPVATFPKHVGVVTDEDRDLASRPAAAICTQTPEELGKDAVHDYHPNGSPRHRRRVPARGESEHRLGAVGGTEGDRLRLVQTFEVDHLRVVNDLEGVCDLLRIANSV